MSHNKKNYGMQDVALQLRCSITITNIGRPGSVSMSGASHAADPGSNLGEGDFWLPNQIVLRFWT